MVGSGHPMSFVAGDEVVLQRHLQLDREFNCRRRHAEPDDQPVALDERSDARNCRDKFVGLVQTGRRYFNSVSESTTALSRFSRAGEV
jgi:hypothetical protein